MFAIIIEENDLVDGTGVLSKVPIKGLIWDGGY